MTRNEKKAAMEVLAEKLMSIEDSEGRSAAFMAVLAYVEGKAAGKAEERRRWEQKQILETVNS